MFVNARPTGGVVVVDGDRFLALRRARPPRAGRWELPGGFCDGAEHPAAAAGREAREELGVPVELGQFIGMYVGSYDYQGESVPVLDCYYLATLAGHPIELNAAESSEMTWYYLVDPPPLAFPSMDHAVVDAARSLGLR